MIRLLLVLIVMLPVACTKHTTGPTKNLLRLPLFAEPATLDSASANDEASLEVLFALQQGLTKRDTYGRVIPALAERWEIAKDGKHLTFFLRSTKWSDGVDVRAQDFVFAWQRVLDPKNTNPLAARLFAIENAEAFHSGTVLDFAQVGVRATEPLRLEISLAHTDAMLLETLSTVLTAPQRQ
jgi:oligopeptide transport system substrate-binding protein